MKLVQTTTLDGAAYQKGLHVKQYPFANLICLPFTRRLLYLR